MNFSQTQIQGLQHIEQLFDLLEEQRHGIYIGESISQLEHSLQAAHFAEEEESTDEPTIVAALLHDVGQFIPVQDKFPMAKAIRVDSGQSVGRMGHDKLGESFLQQHGWPANVYQLVGAHVDAKRYLTIDQEYHDSLSSASQASLKHQGGPFNQQEAEEFRQDPLWKNKIQLRLCDDRAKVVGMKTKSLLEYKCMAKRVWLAAN